jgi:hypothetical protein
MASSPTLLWRPGSPLKIFVPKTNTLGKQSPK